jgi:putative DNA primase/helicase
LLLVLDELSEAEPKDAGATAYMLANGQGKGRANRNGDIRQRKRWRLLFLSSGEISLSDHLRSDGRKVKAGQEVRLIDLPADTGLHGVFEKLHDYADGAALAREIYQATATDYGHAGIEFVRKVSDNRQEAQEIVAQMTKAIQARLPQGVDGQVVRVAGRFALLAAAGELATRWGITGWPEGEALRGTMTCLTAWLASRGGYDRHEETEIISQVKRFFEAHGMARFSNADHPDERTVPNMAGYRKDTGEGWEYFVYPETFRQEVCNGLNLPAACKLLSDKGLMIPGSDRTNGLHRFNGRQQRFFHIAAAVTD